MPQNKQKRQEWDERAMKEAINAVKEKRMGWQLAAKTFSVPATTLRRRFKKNDATKGDLGGRRTVLPREVEEELVQHIIDMETRFFGFTMKDLKRLVYDIADRNNLKHEFNTETKMAGKRWIKGFLSRNPRISLRIPENTSYARAQAFNKNNIKSYFSALDIVLREHNFSSENIFNVDESGLSTVQKKPSKIFATRGRKQVGTLSSAERGKHLTVVCAMNAIGTFIPPIFIFSRKRFKNELMDNAPPGSRAFCQEKGWMTGELFLKWLQHFVQYAKPSIERKILLLLDGHSSHKNLQVLEFAKQHGIMLFCFPAHCTHRVQPLDVGFFAPLQIYYDQEIQLWLKQHPGRIVTDFQLAGLFKNAFLKSATPGNAVNAFAKTGIAPFNPNVFEDWMFAPSLTTDQPIPEHRDDEEPSKDKEKEPTNLEIKDNEQPEEPRDEAQTPEDEEEQTYMEIKHTEQPEQPREVRQTSGKVEPSTSKISRSIAELSPIPIATARPERKRKRGKTGILNSTPDIVELKQKEDEKAMIERRKLAKKAKKKVIIEEYVSNEEEYENSTPDVKELKQKEGEKAMIERKKYGRRAKKEVVIEEGISNEEEYEEYGTDVDDNESDVGCLYCNELYSRSRNKETWIQCQTCRSWCHTECAGVDKKTKQFLCELC